MASYSVNEAGLAKAKALIQSKHYTVKSSWGDVQPNAEAENRFLERHSWDKFGAWHLALAEGATEETKSRYGFGFGDFRRLHRSALIACQYRAAEWSHKEIELAAHDLLQLLDRRRG